MAPLRADAVHLKQIILNLLSNAIKFTPHGGEVRIAAEQDDGGVTIVVHDTGIGMRPEDVAAALEPFRQIDSSLSRKFEGAGLGLPLSKSLVELHGGHLEIRTALGGGATVAVTLPRLEAVAAA